MDKPLVIVLSRNYSTGLGVIRSLGAAGYTVDLIASTKQHGSSAIVSSSRHVRRCTEVLSPKIQGDDGAGLIRAVMDYADTDGGAVLFPTDDYTVSIVAANMELLSEHFVMPHIVGGTGSDLLAAMDKSYQHHLAQEAGLYTPAQWEISLRDGVTLPEDICYPCFVKPMQSALGRKAEMRRCDTAAELTSHLEWMREYYSDRSVLIQQYLDIEREYDFSGICLDDRIIIPSVIEKTGISRHERGVTMTGRMVPVTTPGDAMDGVVTMLQQLHYVGMFDMELSLCGGKLYFGEVNLRSGGPNYAYRLCGANLPALLVQELTTGTHDAAYECIDSVGSTFLYEKVAWEDYIYSHITRAELRDIIRSADHTLLADADDPRPGRMFARRIRLSAIKHRLLRLLGRE